MAITSTAPAAANYPAPVAVTLMGRLQLIKRQRPFARDAVTCPQWVIQRLNPNYVWVTLAQATLFTDGVFEVSKPNHPVVAGEFTDLDKALDCLYTTAGVHFRDEVQVLV